MPDNSNLPTSTGPPSFAEVEKYLFLLCRASLTRGIAHDINNHLTAVTIRQQMLGKQLETLKTEQIARRFSDLEKAIFRLTEFIDTLFMREQLQSKPVLVKVPLHIHQAVAEIKQIPGKSNCRCQVQITDESTISVPDDRLLSALIYIFITQWQHTGGEITISSNKNSEERYLKLIFSSTSADQEPETGANLTPPDYPVTISRLSRLLMAFYSDQGISVDDPGEFHFYIRFPLA